MYVQVDRIMVVSKYIRNEKVKKSVAGEIGPNSKSVLCVVE